MEKIRYMISDAANLVDVESHVLRYWEDELELTIPRNEMGHRYYTKENIQEFLKIKELKEQGYQLKAIRMIVHNGTVSPVGETIGYVKKGDEKTEKTEAEVPAIPGEPGNAANSIMSNTDKMEQFTELMSQIVGKALEANNQKLSEHIGEEVGEQVIKEMNYLMREREDAEEERFRRLDEAIRGHLTEKKGTQAGWKLKWGKKR